MEFFRETDKLGEVFSDLAQVYLVSDNDQNK